LFRIIEAAFKDLGAKAIADQRSFCCSPSSPINILLGDEIGGPAGNPAQPYHIGERYQEARGTPDLETPSLHLLTLSLINNNSIS